jgi:uridine monophosphate synthetase
LKLQNQVRRNKPYYIDLRCILPLHNNSAPLRGSCAKIKEITVVERIDKLASTSQRVNSAQHACNLNLPCVIVRKEEKVYGVTGRMAGADVAKGDNILFFDDVISEGLSKVEGIKPLLELGANVGHLLVVVNREHGGKEKLEKLGYKVHSLSKITDIVDSLYREKRISKDQADKVLKTLKIFILTNGSVLRFFSGTANNHFQCSSLGFWLISLRLVPILSAGRI